MTAICRTTCLLPLLLAAIYIPAVAQEAAVPITPYPTEGRLVGMAYSPWFPPCSWDNTWSWPELGPYDSADPEVIRQHARWIADAGVDFILVDWSNNIAADHTAPQEPQRMDLLSIERATTILMDEYTRLERHPKVSIMLGCPDTPEAVTDGRLTRKADQIYERYVQDPHYRDLLQDLDGKPLMVIYVGTPSPFQTGTPDWDDDRFTVRWMTGFITQQHNLRTEDLVSRYGFWSWEDRGPQTYPVRDGHPEVMTVVACWRDDPEAPCPGRRDGATFREEWARARTIGPRVALVVSWNEWTRAEQPSLECSKDIEPSVAFGHRYLDILTEEAAAFKEGR